MKSLPSVKDCSRNLGRSGTRLSEGETWECTESWGHTVRTFSHMVMFTGDHGHGKGTKPPREMKQLGWLMSVGL